MYSTSSTLSFGGGLAMTGLTGNVAWLFLAGFAMLALGLAILRTAPRSQR